MEFTPLEHDNQSAKPSLTTAQITALCERAFGHGVTIKSVTELGGGTFNTTYLIEPQELPKAILRVAPASGAVGWDEVTLMRREHSIQPYFAPIANLMPKTLHVDFTRQLIDHDYMVQSFIEGERWDNIEDQLTPDEESSLWRQFGELTRTIHNIEGEAFGFPYPGAQFATWSQTLIDRFARIEKELQSVPDGFADIVNIVCQHAHLLDVIERPRLLHGDLWLFNLLVKRTPEGARIVGVLDADRAWWGDPYADWTMFILANAPDEPKIMQQHALFWQAYGQPEERPGHAFRLQVYEAMHASTALIWATAHNDNGTIKRAHGKLKDVAARFAAQLTTLVR